MLTTSQLGILDYSVTTAGMREMLECSSDIPSGGPLVNSGPPALFGRGVGGPGIVEARDQLLLELATSVCWYKPMRPSRMCWVCCRCSKDYHNRSSRNQVRLTLACFCISCYFGPKSPCCHSNQPQDCELHDTVPMIYSATNTKLLKAFHGPDFQPLNEVLVRSLTSQSVLFIICKA